METRRPLVVEIKRFALEDGPGIRTTVFFKGCQLRCLWCQNPDALKPGPEVGFYAHRCRRLGYCVAACPKKAVSLDNSARIDRRSCDNCGECAGACPGRGLRLIGKFYSLEELTESVLRDRMFYQTSGGGVTMSGGEPTLYLDFLSLLLKALKGVGVHTALQTNGFFDWREFVHKALPHLDLIMFDVKLADPREHRQYTGRGNSLILTNLARLLQARPEAVLPRIPLIPGITAHAANLHSISRLLQNLGVSRLSLLPYNPVGVSKAEYLGKTIHPQLPRQPLPPEELASARKIFSWAELVSF